MGPTVSLAQIERVTDYVRIGREEGATVATGGGRLSSGGLGKGYFHEPTIFTDVRARDAHRARGDLRAGRLGAVVPVARRGVAIANDVAYGLSASIYTRDINKAFAAMRDVYTGIFYVNAPTIGAEVHLPFGGTKATGNGHREAGTAALDVFSEWKSVYVDFSGKLQRAQIDTVQI